MGNKKLILGVAAGVAALAVVGVICKRKGYFDNFSERASEFGSNLKDKFDSVKESARKKFDETVQKGGDIAEKASQSAVNGSTAAGTKSNGARSNASGAGNINPATT